MNVKTQWKIIGVFFIVLLTLSFLERLGIPLELVLISSLFIGLVFIIILPEWFIRFLRNLIRDPKNGKKRDTWDSAWRVGLLLLVKRIHEAFWGRKV